MTKVARYSFLKAPGVTSSRRQALQTFLSASKLTDADTMTMARRWAAGIDIAETAEGDAFRAQVASASEVVITLVDPPPPPPPPVLVPLSLERRDALTAADVLRQRAEQIKSSTLSVGVERVAELNRIASQIEAAAMSVA